MRKGSVTIFLCLVMTVMVSLLLGCIFSVKVRAGRAMLVNGTDQALFSLLARYDRQMLEDFDVFLLDGGIGTSELHPEKLSQWAAEDLSYVADPARGLRPLLANSLFDLSVSACDLTGYTLATDAGGRIFRDAALRFEKETAAISAAVAAVNWIQSLINLTNTQEQAFAVVSAAAADGNLDEARSAAKGVSKSLSEAAVAAENAQAAVGGSKGLAGSGEEVAFERLSASEESAEETLAGELPEGELPAGISESMPYFNMILSSPILTLTLTDAQSFSWRSVKAGELFSNRRHRQGVGVLEVPECGDSLTDKFLYNEYLLSHLGNRKNPQKDAALLCPAEYLIAGKTNDAKNVEGVINRILLFREGVNIVYLLKDPVKSALLKTAGLVLALAIGQPELEKEFSVSLAAAWAYTESLVDIRGLFLGKRNCFLKDSSHWQVELTDLPAFFSGGLDRLVKGSAAGPAYLDYLRMFLLLKNPDTLLRRSLDMVELCERGTKRGDFRLDNCLTSVTVYAEALSERRVRMTCERSLGYREL